MLSPAVLPIVIPKHQPFSLSVKVPLLDYSGSAWSLEIRANVADAAALLSDAGAAVFVGGDGTTVTFAISKATIEAVAEAVPLGSDLVAYYGVKCDGLEWLKGTATIEGQANHG